MDNRFRYRTVAMILALGSLAGMAESLKTREAGRIILVKVLNTAGAPLEMLQGAEQQMAQVYRRFGATVVWQYTAEVPRGEPSLGAAEGYAVYYLRILRREGAYRKELDPRAAGYAAPGSRFVSVFYDRIQDEAAVMDVPEHVIFGYVVAHELGHTFLPANCHAPGSVMSAHMEKEYWNKARKGWLNFRPEDGKQILAALRR